MTTSALIQRAAPPLARWMALVLLVSPFEGWGETIRISAWTMGPNAAGDVDSQALVDAAATFRRINPDVILLQGIPDRARCLQLIEALGSTNYTLAACSSFAKRPIPASTNVAGLEELKRSYQTRIAKAQTELLTAQQTWTERQAALGSLGKQLLAQGAMDWPEVTAPKVGEYADTVKELDKLKEQERELLRRGYKDAHPLLQTVRTLLRTYDSQRVELERAFPTLKYLGNNGDMGTNTAAQDIVGRLTELRKLRGQVSLSGNALSNLEFEASRIVTVESKIAEVEKLRLDQQRANGTNTEVAVLTRRSNSEAGVAAWIRPEIAETSGGFAYAKVSSGTHSVVCFSATCSDAAQVQDAVQQLLAKLTNLKSEQEGQAPPVVIGAGFSSITRYPAETRSGGQMLEGAGFIDGLRDLPAGERALLDSRGEGSSLNHILITDTAYPFSPQLFCRPEFDHCLMACDVELDSTKVAAALRARNELQNASSRPVGRPANPLLQWRNPAIAGISGLIVFPLLFWTWRRSRKRRGRALVRVKGGIEPLQSSAYTVVLAPNSLAARNAGSAAGPGSARPVLHVETPITTQTQSASWQRRALAAEAAAERANAVLRAGLLPELSRWLKQKVMRKLVSDREKLLESQQAATRQVMAVDERLARIETQLQHQNRAYVRRIEELTADLQAAKEENRELIRARIAQVRKEMDAAREKLLREEKENRQS